MPVHFVRGDTTGVQKSCAPNVVLAAGPEEAD